MACTGAPVIAIFSTAQNLIPRICLPFTSVLAGVYVLQFLEGARQPISYLCPCSFHSSHSTASTSSDWSCLLHLCLFVFANMGGTWRAMGVSFLVLVLIGLISCVFCQSDGDASSAKVFDDNFQIMWAQDHFRTSENGQVWHLALDQKSGSGFKSKSKYRFGWFSMKLKLVPGDSAGVVTAYYMSSDNNNTRDELDFEFLGNRSGEPYALQTNIYANGVGGREKRHILWFDPTTEFHTYSFLWNSRQIVFFVDEVPVRVYRHTKATRGVFPHKQGMYMFSSIWNADNWATRGGLEKTNWAAAPFVSSYKKFHGIGCKLEDGRDTTLFPCANNNNAGASRWWNEPAAWTLTKKQREYYRWVNRKYLVYDYCNDQPRYSIKPVECSVD